MVRSLRFIAVAALCLGYASSASAKGPGSTLSPKAVDSVDGTTRVLQVGSERAPGEFDPAVYARQRVAIYESLANDAEALTNTEFNSIPLNTTQAIGLEESECRTCGDDVTSTTKRVRIGVNAAADIYFSLEGIAPTAIPANSTSHQKGMLRSFGKGGFAWTTGIESNGATAMRLHLTQFTLPEGVEMYLYTSSREVFGPYTGLGPNGDGDFWSNTLIGDTVYVEVRATGAVTADQLAAAGFKISEVGHMGDKFLHSVLAAAQEVPSIDALCSYNASCVQDASCYGTSTWGAIDQARAGVAHMLFVSGAFQYMCSGGLLNDTVTSSQIPYFLTANHCISKANVAKTLECYWNYRTTSCGGVCTSPYGVVPRTLGSTLLKTSTTSDYTLLRLNAAPPAGAVFMGWNATAVANSNGTALYRISHPQGAPQAYSQHAVNTSAGTCRTWPRGSWIYSKDVIGATEGGSSGSPVLNAAGQVVGQLSGACGTNTSNVCDSTRNATVDGALAAYYSAIQPYLAP